MSKNKLILLLAISVVLSIGNGCKKDSDTEPADDNTEITIEDAESYDLTGSDVMTDNDGDHEEESDYVWDANSATQIVLNGSSITVTGSGAVASGSTVTVTADGTFNITGTLSDGQLIVDAPDDAVVKLIFNGIAVTNASNAPVNIINADKVIVILPENTQSTLTDAATYIYENADDDEPNAALFSKTDLSIFGDGSLTVSANYNDGITSKDGLIIKSGTISVTSVDDGIRGKDYLIVRDGNITLNTSGDGLKSDNDDDVTRGYIYIEKGTFEITSKGDAITAETDVIIESGTFDLESGGGSSLTAGSTSSKAIKGISRVVIDYGDFTISSADDAIHSNGSIVVNDGVYNISSGDDGMHADTTLGINGGTIDITKSYEGIESRCLLISGGTIHVKASDDGINGAGGYDGSGGGSFPGGTPSSGDYYLYITGGYIYVNASGDGIDVNGTIEMSGGIVIVDGPTSSGNGALDYDVAFKITGGYLLAVGSSDMAMAPSTSSTQNSLLVNFSQTQSAGTIVRVQNSSGGDIFTYSPAKYYQSVAFSSADLKTGSSYDVYLGGSSTGTPTDGLYQDGTYSGGSKYTSFTVSSVVTKIGSTSVPH